MPVKKKETSVKDKVREIQKTLIANAEAKKAARHAANVARSAKRAEAKATVHANISAIPETDGLRAAIVFLIGDGSRSAKGGGRTTKLQRFMALFNDANVVSAFDVFKSMRIGLAEGRRLMTQNDKEGVGKDGYKKVVYLPMDESYHVISTNPRVEVGEVSKTDGATD